VKFRQGKQSKPVPVLLDQALRERIDSVSQKMGEPKSTVMRIAMRLGLDGLEKSFSYPVAAVETAIVDEASSSQTDGVPTQGEPAVRYVKKKTPRQK
jgi:predicted DNA-binding protein